MCFRRSEVTGCRLAFFEVEVGDGNCEYKHVVIEEQTGKTAREEGTEGGRKRTDRIMRSILRPGQTR